MDDFDNDAEMFGAEGTLNLDGDIVIYRPCCIFNEDTDADRNQIVRLIKKQIEQLTLEANCTDYSIFLTTSFNFRDHLVDDYKANRDDVERPVNLAWVKRWAVDNLNAVFHKYLEADDLLGIYQTENTVIWSLDKDLRQIPGKHIDDATRKVITVTNQGILKDLGKKTYFDGMLGFYYQCLVGDTADYIIGCGIRKLHTYKSGAKKGQDYMKRVGIGPKKAFQLILKAALEGGTEQEILLRAKRVVAKEYHAIHGNAWRKNLETQANLLWMVREQHGDIIRQWSYEKTEKRYFDIVKGVVVNDFTPPN